MTEFIGCKAYNNSEIYCLSDNVCLHNFPILSIATLYNYFEKKSGACCELERPHINHYCNTNHIILNVVDLEENEFFNLFYHNSSKYFCVNKALITNSNIIFSEQNYISNNSRVNHFSLYNEVLKCFEENYNISINNVNPGSLISLQKEVYKTQSLASICGTQISLSWDQVINGLISNGKIEHSSRNNCAPIIFQVTCRFFSCALNVYLNVTFQYKVHISGYCLKKGCSEPSSCDSSSSSSCCDSSTDCHSSCNSCGESSSNCCCDSSSCTSESVSSGSDCGCHK
jgi:hypothetical protein